MLMLQIRTGLFMLEQSSEIDKCRKEGLGGVGVETSVSRLGHTVIAAG